MKELPVIGPKAKMLSSHGVIAERKIGFVHANVARGHGLIQLLAMECDLGSRNRSATGIFDCSPDVEHTSFRSGAHSTILDLEYHRLRPLDCVRFVGRNITLSLDCSTLQIVDDLISLQRE